MWRNLTIHAVKSTFDLRQNLGLLVIHGSAVPVAHLLFVLPSTQRCGRIEQSVTGGYILVQYFVEQFGIISQKKQCLDLRLLAFIFRYTCVLHCSSKNPETTHQGTVEFFATFGKIKVHVCFQGEREKEKECVCVFAGTCFLFWFCVFFTCF